MTDPQIKRALRKLWRDWLVIVGLGQPEIASAFVPGWTAELRDDAPAEPFKAKPRKRRKEA